MTQNFCSSQLLPRRFLTWLLSSVLLLAVLLADSPAQVSSAITSDNTRGTTVTQNGRVYTITGGTRPGNGHGPNLFHSFERFSVGTGDTARFSGPAGIENILSRVTGGERSMIDGLLQSTIPGANLYLLNPSGVVFGPNASLDVKGSFHVSTADYLRLADGEKFSATLGKESVLTVAPPVAFGFLRENAAGISVRGSTLEVPGGEAISVAGGNIRIERGGLRAPSGQVHLASVASAGEVVPTTSSEAPDLRVDALRLGEVTFSQGTFINASGDSGGTVLIRGNRLIIDGANVFANTEGNIRGAPTGIDVQVVGEVVVTNGARLTSQALSGSRGQAGNIRLAAGTLELTEGAQIDSSTLGVGSGGTVTVTATEAVTVRGPDSEGNPSGIFSGTSGSGRAGRVLITTPTMSMEDGIVGTGTFDAGQAGSVLVEVGSLTLTNGAQIDSSSFSTGSGGTVTVTATDTVALAGMNERGLVSAIFAQARGVGAQAGNAGTVIVEARNVTATEGAQIGSTSFGAGNGGIVRVTASDTIALMGTAPNRAFPSGVFANAQGSSLEAGDAGTVVVEAKDVMVTEGAQIDSISFGPGQGGAVTVRATDTLTLRGTAPNGAFPSGIFANAQGSSLEASDAGTVVVEAKDVMVTEGARISSTALGSGQGGTVRLTVTDAVSLTKNALVDASGNGGGTVVIRGDSLLVDQASISATTFGDVDGAEVGVDIAVAQDVRLTQGAFTTETRGTGNAGDVRIAAQSLQVADGFIGAGTSGDGRAGDVVVQVGTLTLGIGAQIDSTTVNAGQGGDVMVTATDGVTIAGPNNLDNPFDLAGLFAGTFGRGHGGRVTISTSTLTMEGFASISASTFSDEGNAGSIEVEADSIVIADRGSIFSDTQGPGSGGMVAVTARDTLSIRNGGRISISTFDRGDAGRVIISTPNLVMEGGVIQAVASENATGAAGTIQVEANRIDLVEGAQIDSSTDGAGRGGSVTISATDAILISGTGSTGNPSGFLNETANQGNAGDLVISTSTLTMDGGVIRTRTTGEGNAGSIEVDAERVTLTGGAQLDSDTFGTGRGGTITVMATDAVTIRGMDGEGNASRLSSASVGSGAAGRISVSTANLTIEAGGLILAASAREGSAGTIDVNAERVAVTDGAQINSRTQSGEAGGTVLLSAEEIHLTQDGNIGVTGGGGGVVRIQGGRLVMDSAFINASTQGDVDGGGIAIHLTGDLSISNIGGILAATFGKGRGGDITVEAGHIMLTNGAEINSSTAGPGRGGKLTVMAHDSITISGRSPGPVPVLSGLVTNTRDTGEAGEIFVSTPTLNVDDGTIEARTFGTGRAGDIRIEVGSLTLTGGSQIASSNGGTDLGTGEVVGGNGQSGNLTITAEDSIIIAGRDVAGFPSGLFTNTIGSGHAGSIAISAPRIMIEGGRITSATTGDGNAGNLTIDVERLVLTSGAQIASASGNNRGEAGRGEGGNIALNAEDTVFISGEGSVIASTTFGAARAGDIILTAAALEMENGGAIEAESLGGQAGDIEIAVHSLLLTDSATISSGAFGTEEAGDVSITATDLISLSNHNRDGLGGIINSSTFGPGAGGDITLQAKRIELSDSSIILALSASEGKAGNILLQAHDTLTSNNSIVTTEALQADGGDIQVMAQNLLRLRNSQMTTAVGSGEGAGGNITIDPEFVILEDSQISADAFGGPGGNIRLTAEVFLANPASSVTASSVLNLDGEIDIRAPVTNLSGVVAPLPQRFTQAAALLRQRCAERLRGGQVSSFVLTGRDGVPAEPEGGLPSPLMEAEGQTVDRIGRRDLQGRIFTSSRGLVRDEENGTLQLRGLNAPPLSQAAWDVECAR